VPMAWGGRQRAMETAQHRDRLAKNQPAEITMFQISEVQESPAFNGRRSFLALRDHKPIARLVQAILARESSDCRGTQHLCFPGSVTGSTEINCPHCGVAAHRSRERSDGPRVVPAG
jgi:hypothetical protein